MLMVPRRRDEMKRMLQSNWLAERERWAYRARFLSRKNKFCLGQLMNSFLTRMALTFDLFFTVLKAQKKKRTWPITILFIRLSPRAGKMKRIPRSMIGHQRRSRKKSSLFNHVKLPLLTKLVQSRWLYIGLALFWVLVVLDFLSANKNVDKNLAGQDPVILTSRLVNNAYILI